MKISNIVGLTIGILTIISIVGGIFKVYGDSTNEIKHNSEDVEKLEIEVDDQEGRLDELEQFSVKQTILIERVTGVLDRLERPLRQPSNYLPGI